MMHLQYMKKERGKKLEYIKFLEIRLSGVFVKSALLIVPFSLINHERGYDVNMGVGLGMDSRGMCLPKLKH